MPAPIVSIDAANETQRPIPAALEKNLATASREALAFLVKDLYWALWDERNPIKHATQHCHYCGVLTAQHAYITTRPTDPPSAEVVWPSCCQTCAEVELWEPIPVAECPQELLERARRCPYHTPCTP